MAVTEYASEDDAMPPARSVLEIVQEVAGAEAPASGMAWQVLWSSAMEAMVKGSKEGARLSKRPADPPQRLPATRLAPSLPPSIKDVKHPFGDGDDDSPQRLPDVAQRRAYEGGERERGQQQRSRSATKARGGDAPPHAHAPGGGPSAMLRP